MPNNAFLPFRPLRPSTLVYNPLTSEAGTLGYIARQGQSRYLVSCAHVLIGKGQHPQPIYQPSDEDGLGPVAETSGSMIDHEFDMAGARIFEAVACVNEPLVFGPLRGPWIDPDVGMRVVKFGATTGATEGQITSVEAGRFKIALPSFYPAGGTLSAAGDSGSLWIELESRRPVGFHYLGGIGSQAFAYARIGREVMSRLGLQEL